MAKQLSLFIENPDGTFKTGRHTWEYIENQYRTWEAEPNRATKPNKERYPYIMNFWWGELQKGVIVNTPDLTPGEILRYVFRLHRLVIAIFIALFERTLNKSFAV